MPDRTLIPEAERIPLRAKIAFSLGVNTEYVATVLLTTVLWMPYFNLGLGLDPMHLGLVLVILRVWDAFSDPFIGNLSDNARTRWGRRRPFLFAGALLTGLLYPAFWHLPGHWGDTARLVALTLLGLVFFTAFTTWSMPYYGMQMELTPNYDERTRLSAWATVFGKLSYLGGSWILAFVTGPLFANPETGQPDIVAGMRFTGWIIAALIIFFGLLPALFVRERPLPSPAVGQRTPLRQSLRESATCAPLWPLIGVSFFLVLGYTSVSALGNYVYIYALFDGDLHAGSVLFGWKATVNVVTGLASIPLLTWLAERHDKRRMVQAMLLLCLVGYAANIVCLRPDQPYLALLPAMLESCGISAVWLFLPSMKADVADHDELLTGRRREGSLNAFFSWFIKASLTASVGLGGLVLTWSGFDVAAPAQPSEVIANMRNLFIGLPLTFWALALVLTFFYPLTRARMTTIRLELERRRPTPPVASAP